MLYERVAGQSENAFPVPEIILIRALRRAKAILHAGNFAGFFRLIARASRQRSFVVHFEGRGFTRRGFLQPFAEGQVHFRGLLRSGRGSRRSYACAALRLERR